MKKTHFLAFSMLLLSFTINAQVVKHNKEVKLKTVNELISAPPTTKILVLDPINDKIKYIESQDLTGGSSGNSDLQETLNNGSVASSPDGTVNYSFPTSNSGIINIDTSSSDFNVSSALSLTPSTGVSILYDNLNSNTNGSFKINNSNIEVEHTGNSLSIGPNSFNLNRDDSNYISLDFFGGEGVFQTAGTLVLGDDEGFNNSTTISINSINGEILLGLTDNQIDAAPLNNAITKSWFFNNSIPLSGTTPGNPVTGDIEMTTSDLIHLGGDGDDKLFTLETGKFPLYVSNVAKQSLRSSWYDDSLASVGALGIGEGVVRSIVSEDGFFTNYTELNLTGQYKFNSDDPSAKGFDSDFYYGANYTDNTYVQKKYVDDAIALISSSTPTLQQVTNEGNTTTDFVLSENQFGFFSRNPANFTHFAYIGYSGTSGNVVLSNTFGDEATIQNNNTDGLNTFFTLPTTGGVFAVAATDGTTTVSAVPDGVLDLSGLNLGANISSLLPIETLDTGAVISLETSGGNFCNIGNANTNTSYNLSNTTVTGGEATVFVNAPSITVVGANLVTGSVFVPNTNMYMKVENLGNGVINYYFLEL